MQTRECHTLGNLETERLLKTQWKLLSKTSSHGKIFTYSNGLHLTYDGIFCAEELIEHTEKRYLKIKEKEAGLEAGETKKEALQILGANGKPNVDRLRLQRTPYTDDLLWVGKKESGDKGWSIKRTV